MNIFAQFSTRIEAKISALQLQTIDGQAPDLSRMVVEPPRDPLHGDLACNGAMVLAKAVGQNPRQLAQQIAQSLSDDSDVESVDVAGPGFINIRLKHGFWQKHLGDILAANGEYGRATIGGGQSVNVEYVSANPTGPMHVGHCRGAVVGDALANLLKFVGYDVTKEYYLNDAGVQINVLARSVMLRYRQALGETIDAIPEGLYPGEYLVDVGVSLAQKYEARLLDMSEGEAFAIIKPHAMSMMMDMIRSDLLALKVEHDIFFSESKLHENNAAPIAGAIEDLRARGFIYQGTLPPPKGKLPDDWEDREQTLFRSTQVGDDVDRPLVKSDGAYTYFAADVAYMIDKYQRGFNKLIFVLGADHSGYVKRMEALARALSGDTIELDILLCQLVRLFRNGEPVRMGKRTGQLVTLRETVDEVGADAVRFMMLYRKADAPLDFDFAKVMEQSKDNPVFYVQYACARCHSVFRQANEQMGKEIDTRHDGSDYFHLLDNNAEIALIAKLSEYPRLIESAAQSMEPHRIAFYLYEVANLLHGHWNLGNEAQNLRFIKVNQPELTRARLGLVQAVLDVLNSGLAIMGVDAPQEMR